MADPEKPDSPLKGRFNPWQGRDEPGPMDLVRDIVRDKTRQDDHAATDNEFALKKEGLDDAALELFRACMREAGVVYSETPQHFMINAADDNLDRFFDLSSRDRNAPREKKVTLWGTVVEGIDGLDNDR
jgi:hypothetical protein